MEKKKTDSFIVKGIAEFCVFFLATLGFSDFALNTLVFKKAGWVDDKRLTSTMITCYLVPGIIIAFGRGKDIHADGYEDGKRNIKKSSHI